MTVGAARVELIAFAARLSDHASGVTEEAEEAVRRSNAFLSLAVECVVREGGQVDQLGGDTLLAFFGRDGLRVGARAALCAARRLQRDADELALASVGVGVQAGLVTRGTFGSGELARPSAFGRVVDETLWLSACASPGQVLIGDAVYDAIRDELGELSPSSYAMPRGAPSTAYLLAELDEARSSPLVGRTLGGRYSVEALIGIGATASVYRATSCATGGRVAVKVLHDHIESEPGHRFEQEARAAGALSHVNTVRVMDFGRDGRFRYLVMEHLGGTRLKDLLDDGAMGWERAAHITRQVLRALEEAHRAGIVHRDIKPANLIVLDEPGQRDFVKVVDFGVARIAGMTSDTVRPIGTPSYIAPELWQGREVGPAADLYSLGCVLYELLTGRPPFEATTIPRLGLLHAYEAPPALPPQVPAGLATLCSALLEKDPAGRPKSAAEAADLLDRLLATPESSAATGPGVPAGMRAVVDPSETLPESADLERIPTLPRWRAARVLPLAAAAAALLGSVAWGLWPSAGGPVEPAETLAPAEPPQLLTERTEPRPPEVPPRPPVERTVPDEPSVEVEPAPGRPRSARRSAPGDSPPPHAQAVGHTSGQMSPNEF